MKIKHEIEFEHYKERKQENDHDLKTKMPKWMVNAFFYMHSSILAGWNDIDAIRIWQSVPY
jgi:hypothetical protein